MNSPIRILIVDDHPTIREGLATRISIEPDMTVCGGACDVGEALNMLDSLTPNVAIVDISLKNSNGLELIKRIRDRNSDVRILVWSMYEEDLYADRALRAGAMGYVTKQASTETIIDGIRRICAGQVFLSPEMSGEMLTRFVRGQDGVKPSPTACLSDRELEVFGLIGHGLTTKQLAERMRLSPKTVETYRARIKEKLGLETGAQLSREAAQWVLENG